MNTKQNARYELTDAKIREFFLKELEVKPISRITVTDICKGVGINRSSFYAHYQDVYEISEKLAATIHNSLSEKYKGHSMTEESIGTRESFLITLEHIKANQNFYRSYLSHTNIETINNHFNQIFESSASPYLEKHGISDLSEQHYYYSFFIAGLIQIVKEWLKGSCLESPEIISDIVIRSTQRHT